MTSPRIYILLLNFQGADHTLACLDSLRKLNYPDYKILVIDNASSDDSLVRLKARLQENPGEFQLIESSENLGFSGGNNLGIEAALQAETTGSEAYVWLLNNDTSVAPDALSHLVREAQKTGGVAGGLLLHPDGRYQQVGTRLNRWTGASKGYKETEVRDGMMVETLSGACMLIPLAAVRKAGLMDPSFFLYFEDGEYSLRLKRHGFPLTVSTQAKIFHTEGATTGRKSLNTQYYYHRNRLRLLSMIANPLQQLSFRWYATFRMGRTGVKSLLSADPQRKIEAKVQQIALQDFHKGISGPCPHNWDTLR